jgi:hypothetical protein
MVTIAENPKGTVMPMRSWLTSWLPSSHRLLNDRGMFQR